MKKLNAFLFLILIILLLTILLVVQNLTQLTIHFLTFKINTSAGLFGIVMLLSGIVLMWLISLIAHYREIANLKRKLLECEDQINKLKEECKEKKEESKNTQTK